MSNWRLSSLSAIPRRHLSCDALVAPPGSDSEPLGSGVNWRLIGHATARPDQLRPDGVEGPLTCSPRPCAITTGCSLFSAPTRCRATHYPRRTLDLSDPANGLGPIVHAEIDPTGQISGPVAPITKGLVSADEYEQSAGEESQDARGNA